MSYSVRVLAQPAVAAGFRLAGLPSLEAASPPTVRGRWRHCSMKPGLGVILVEADIFDAISEEVRHELSRRPLPMVVPFPARPGSAPPRGRKHSSPICSARRSATG